MDGCSVIIKGASLSCCLEAMDIGSEGFIILLLYLHRVRCVGMDICVTELQLKDALDFIPIFSCLEHFADESVG